LKTKGPYEDTKTVILVSSVLAWGDTPRIVKPPEEKEEEEGEGEGEEGIKEEEPKEEEDNEEEEEEKPESVKEEENKQEGEEGEIQAQEGEGTGEEQPVEQKVEEPEEEEEPVEYLPFKEKDYLIRVPKEKYERFKRLEDAVLNLNIENVKTFVICSGVFYGKGELAFKETLKVLCIFSV